MSNLTKLSQLNSIRTIKNYRHFNKATAGVGILLFAAIGTVLLFSSRAATPFGSVDLGQGSAVTYPAVVVSDSSAAGSSAVKFGGVVTSGSRRGWEVTEANTGLSGVGVNRDTLPLFDDSGYATNGAAVIIPANTTITMKKFTRPVMTGGPGIVFDRVYFAGESLSGGFGTIVKDSDFDGNSTACGSINDVSNYFAIAYGSEVTPGVSLDGNLILQRIKIQRWGNGVWLGGGSGARPTIENSFINHLIGCGDPGTTGTHNETVRIGDSYTGPGAIIRNNFLDAREWSGSVPNSTGAIFIIGDGGSTRYVTTSGNVLLSRGDWGVQVGTHNGGYVGDLLFDDNRFGIGNGCACDAPNSVQTNNYRYDPTQPDAKGAPL